MRDTSVRLLSIAMEGVLFAFLCLSPWFYGARFPQFEAALYVGICLLTLLWAIKILLAGTAAWRWCPALICLTLLFLIGIGQITPLSRQTLTAVSPATAALYSQLLPDRPEVLPFDVAPVVLQPPAGSTISIYPAGSQEMLVRLLAVLLLYSVVRFDLASPTFFRRLCIVVLLNGTALALFGIIQFFSSDHTVLYWTYPSRGSVFGPFVNRNHFAFYINICIGLAIGLLLSRTSGQESRGIPKMATTLRGRLLDIPAQILQDAGSLWICLGLGVMVAANLICVSRGGFLALLGAVAICFFMRAAPRQALSRGAALIAIAAVSAGLLGWVGFDLLESRLSTLWKGNALEVSRLDVGRMQVWEEDAMLVQDFPVWGTGLGSHLYAEHLHRRSPPSEWVNAHALNEYLELLVEAGIVGLSIGLFAIGYILYCVDRGLQQHRHHRTAGLLLGGLFAYITVLIHSFVEFGLHIQAITYLATVVVGSLVGIARPVTPYAAGEKRRSRGRSRETWPTLSPDPSSAGENAAKAATQTAALAPRLRTLPLVIALGLSAVVLYSAGWRMFETERLRRMAIVPSAQAIDKENHLSSLSAAGRLSPGDSRLHVEIAKAYEDRFVAERQQLFRDGDVLTACRIMGNTALGANAPAVASSILLRASTPASDAADNQLKRRFLVPALQHYLQARAACLLNATAHLGIASHAEEFASADSVAVYLTRIKLLAPANFGFWYFCGLHELAAGDLENACGSWRRSLVLSPHYAPAILANLEDVLAPADIAAKVLPDRPDVLITAAKYLYPHPADLGKRKPLLQRALAALAGQPTPLALTELYLKAQLHIQLNDSAAAATTYDELRIRAPLRLDWQLEFAQFLYESGDLDKARGHLYQILALQPDNASIRQLLTVVEREINLNP